MKRILCFTPLLARGFIAPYPILLLDEPTASLDLKNRETVIQLIMEALKNNTCVIGVFHDPADHRSFADQVIDVQGRLIMPGLVDLHSDSLERSIEKRKGVFFDIDFAVLNLDRQAAACGTKGNR